MNDQTSIIHQPEPPEEIEATAVDTALARTDSATTAIKLAALGVAGEQVIKSLEAILQTAQKASIMLTAPEDWLLFRDRSGRVTAYLQDSGCKRLLPLWGIQVTNLSPCERFEEGGEFGYSLKADGYCRLTDTWIYGVEGCRTSEEDFVRQVKSPVQKQVRVRQAARANLDGNIVRRLSGLQNVPAAMLEEAWRGSNKSISRCTLGKGYGTQAERAGAVTQEAAHVAAGSEPTCEICGARAKFWPAGVSKTSNKPYDSFWACPSREHKWTMRDSEWRSIKSQPAPTQPAEREPGGEG